DFTPVGDPANLTKMAEVGREGVLYLLSDSTNSEIAGFTMSEQVVKESINDIFSKVDERLIFATFASNIYRLQQVVEAAAKHTRKSASVGGRKESTIDIGRDHRYIKPTTNTIIQPNQITRYASNEIIILCTRPEGEPRAALSRIANGTNRQIAITPGETVVFSSPPIS